MLENAENQQPQYHEYHFTAIEHKLLADIEAEAQRIKVEAERAIADLNQRSFGALQLILRQQGIAGDAEVLPGLAGVRVKIEPPKE